LNKTRKSAKVSNTANKTQMHFIEGRAKIRPKYQSIREKEIDKVQANNLA
jgi:hypothetical protein